MNNHLEELIRLFKEELVEIYDFSQAPKLITRKKEAQDCTNELSTNQEWVKIQRALLSRTKDKRIYTKEGALLKETFSILAVDGGHSGNGGNLTIWILSLSVIQAWLGY